MKKIIYLLMILPMCMYSQQNFTDNWEDLFSYNDVKDYIIVEDVIYAITQNSMFIYDIESQKTEKFSTVNGLSGNITSSINYDATSDNIFIGYENGLVEVVGVSDKSVFPLTGFVDDLILVNKSVKGFYRFGELTFLYGDFGITELDVDKLEFQSTFKLSSDDTSNRVNQIVINNGVLYAATEKGLYQIDQSSALNDFREWTLLKSGDIKSLISVNDNVFFTIGSNIYEVQDLVNSYASTTREILNLSTGTDVNDLVVSTSRFISVLDVETALEIDLYNLSDSVSHRFTTSKGLFHKDNLYVNSSDFGVLFTAKVDKVNFTEIHPEGPNRNDAFSITVKDDNVWLTYGGWNAIYNFSAKRLGFSGRFDNKWYNIPYSDVLARDLTKIQVNPFDSSKIYVGSLLNGVVLFDYNSELDTWENVGRWNPESTGNGIQESEVPSFDAVIGGLELDNNNKLWVSHFFAKNNEFLSRYNFDSEVWETRVNFSDFVDEAFNDARFINMFFHSDGTVLCGTKRKGVMVFNDSYDETLNSENPTNRIEQISSDANKGALPSDNVRALVVDEFNKVWIGTALGLVVYDDYNNLFSETKSPAKIQIIEEDGVAKELLADTKINDIIIDNTGSKFIATEGVGVFQISADGQTTFNVFNSSNSPLPSDTVLDLELDKSTGAIYMVTDKGIVIYTSKSEPFGTKITPVVAYPNPAVRSKPGHELVTIVAKDGSGIPDGTNVKIMDVSGKLVYETNVRAGQQALGGKIVWDKRNLRGNLVVSGVYVVMLSSSDGTENTITKIAIVN